MAPFLCPEYPWERRRAAAVSFSAATSPPPRLNRPLPHALLLCLAPCAGFAADVPAERTTATPPAARALATPSPISAAIHDSLPHYQPAPTPPPSQPASAYASGSTEAIILLPKMTVDGSKIPTPGEWQILTPAGKAAFLKKHFAGYVKWGSDADAVDESKPNAGMQLLRDEKRQENLGWMKDTADAALLVGDKEETRKIKKEMQQALYRAYDWRTEALDRAYNNDRR